MQESMVVARLATVTMTAAGETFEITKFVDGDYATLEPTSGDVAKMVKGYNGNVSVAMDMNATIGSLRLRVLRNEPFVAKVFDMLTAIQSADTSQFANLSIKDIIYSVHYEADGDMFVREHRASFGIVSGFPVERANASGDTSQNVYEIVMKLNKVQPSGTRKI